jgi:hypothetical protein
MNSLSLQSIFTAAALMATTGISAGTPNTSEIQLLSGTDKDNNVPWDFRVSAYRIAGVCTTIPVPSCWIKPEADFGNLPENRFPRIMLVGANAGFDRDGNGAYFSVFNTLGQDPTADPDGDGPGFLIENAFDLSPSVPDANSLRLPHTFVPGTNSPAAMVYSVPLTRLNEFSFVSVISDSLVDWFDQVAHPDYFQMGTSNLSGERQFSVEYGPAWPGETDSVFLQLCIERK